MNVGYLFSSVLGHLPVLAVLIAGFIVLSLRRSRLSPRSVLLARLGLGMMLFASVVQILWTLSFPWLYRSLDYTTVRYGLLAAGVGLLTSLLTACGIGLLIAAVVTRGAAQPITGPPGPGGTGPGQFPPGYAASSPPVPSPAAFEPPRHEPPADNPALSGPSSHPTHPGPPGPDLHRPAPEASGPAPGASGHTPPDPGPPRSHPSDR